MLSVETAAKRARLGQYDTRTRAVFIATSKYRGVVTLAIFKTPESACDLKASSRKGGRARARESKRGSSGGKSEREKTSDTR